MLEDEFKKKVMLDEVKEDEAERIRIKRKKKRKVVMRRGKAKHFQINDARVRDDILTGGI